MFVGWVLLALVVAVVLYDRVAGFRRFTDETAKLMAVEFGTKLRVEMVRVAGLLGIGVIGLLATPNGSALVESMVERFDGDSAFVAVPGAQSFVGVGGSGNPSQPGAPGGTGGCTYTNPNQPTVTATAFAGTGDSLRLAGSTFAGSCDDTHDSTQFAVAVAGAATQADSGFSGNVFFVTLGAVTTDTVPSLDSSLVYISTTRYKGASSALWSPWADSVSTDMTPAGSGTFQANEPTGMTTRFNVDFCAPFASQSDGTRQTTSLSGESPSVTVEEWGISGAGVIGSDGYGVDSTDVTGMQSPPCFHEQPYSDGLLGQGTSTYEFSLAGSRTTVYVSWVGRYRENPFDHNSNAEKLIYFTGGANYWFGKLGTYFGVEQLGSDKGPTTDSVTVASLDGQFFEAEVCLKAGSGDGELYWWIDGVLQAAYTGLTATAASGLQISATYGGGGSAHTGLEYRDVDHFYVSYGTGSCT